MEIASGEVTLSMVSVSPSVTVVLPTVVPNAFAWRATNVPLFTAVAPRYVLSPDRTNSPAPDLVIPAGPLLS